MVKKERWSSHNVAQATDDSYGTELLWEPPRRDPPKVIPDRI